MVRVHVLGAGTPTPTAERFGSSYVVDVGSERLMFDCGPAATHKLVKAGLRPTQIDRLFFTHHHFDHDVDYPCFLLCRWDQGAGREPTLKVYGPPPTARFTEQVIGEGGAFAHDWIARINAPSSQRVFVGRGGVLPRRPPVVEARDVGPGHVASGRGWRVDAAPAQHVQPWLDSLAYRLDTRDGVIVITGDTQPCKTVFDLAQKADVMLCMCWDHQEDMEIGGDIGGGCGIVEDWSAAACGTVGAAALAQAADVRKLVLVHMGPRVATPSGRRRAREDIAAYYGGEVLFADEGTMFDLG
jgi:ribonuclease BN (tRNA processing enzyme)